MAQNRVTPFGEIVALDQRGTFMGNRGVLHRAPQRIARPWQVRRWITCVLEHKGWVAPRWEPGRWTALFFWDEAVALAAGHRPCALCRRPDFERWCDAWAAAFGERQQVDPMDRRPPRRPPRRTCPAPPHPSLAGPAQRHVRPPAGDRGRAQRRRSRASRRGRTGPRRAARPLDH